MSDEYKNDQSYPSFRSLRTDDVDGFLKKVESNINITGNHGQSLLQEAIAVPRYGHARALIESGVNLNNQDADGKTVLHYAIDSLRGKGDPAEVEELVGSILEKGGSPNIVDKFGNPPIWTAALLPKKNFNIIKTLIKFGADPNIKNNSGKSAIDFAQQTNKVELHNALLSDI